MLLEPVERPPARNFEFELKQVATLGEGQQIVDYLLPLLLVSCQKGLFLPELSLQLVQALAHRLLFL